MANKPLFEQQRKDAIDVIRKNPGITSLALATLLAEGSGFSVKQMQGVISNMIEGKKFVHVRAIEKGHFTYKCYMTVPPETDPRAFERKKKKGLKPEQMPSPPVIIRQQTLELAPPKTVVAASAYDDIPTTAPSEWKGPDISTSERGDKHPVLKPGAFTIDLELPSGIKAAFTLDEARRMYEQLYQLFGNL